MMLKLGTGFLVFFMLSGFSIAQNSSSSSSASDDSWYNPPDCSLATQSPAEIKEKLSILKRVEFINERISNGKVMAVDVVVVGMGTLPFFRGKQNCLKSLASKQKSKNSELDKYR